VDFTFRNHAVARQVPTMVQQEVQLDRSFRGAELRPVEYGRAQIDNSGIQAQQFTRQAQLCTGFGHAQPLLAIHEQLMKHRLEQLPRPVAIGIGQRGTCRRLRQPQMLQLALAGLQSFSDLAQRFGLR